MKYIIIIAIIITTLFYFLEDNEYQKGHELSKQLEIEKEFTNIETLEENEDEALTAVVKVGEENVSKVEAKDNFWSFLPKEFAKDEMVQKLLNSSPEDIYFFLENNQSDSKTLEMFLEKAISLSGMINKCIKEGECVLEESENSPYIDQNNTVYQQKINELLAEARVAIIMNKNIESSLDKEKLSTFLDSENETTKILVSQIIIDSGNEQEIDKVFDKAKDFRDNALAGFLKVVSFRELMSNDYFRKRRNEIVENVASIGNRFSLVKTLEVLNETQLSKGETFSILEKICQREFRDKGSDSYLHLKELADIMLLRVGLTGRSNCL